MSDADSTLPATPGEQPIALGSGAKIGRFSTISTLGAGGMGVVLEAHDPELDRRVAIKLLHRGIGVVELQREAQAMARLSHPNVVAVYDVGSLNGQTFIAMELVRGTTLRAWSKERRTWREVLAHLVGVGRGLAAAHAAGLIHRDVKPENILVGEDGRARVSDFGLVSGVLVTEGPAVGTPGYMSPEHWTGHGVNARSDQFSYCVTVWEALWGQRPFTDDPDGDVVPPPAGSDVPRWVEIALRRGLERDPAARWPDMTGLVDALEAGQRIRRRAPCVIAGIAVVSAALAIATVLVRGSGVSVATTLPAPPTLDLVADSIARLTFDDACDEYPSFSPDGTTVYYDSTVSPDVHLFAIDMVKSTPRELTRTAGVDIAAKVSPDGSRIAFLRTTAELNMSLVVAPIDAPDRVQPIAVSGGRPFWSPDSTHVWSGWIDATTRYDAVTGKPGRILKPTEGHVAIQGIELLDGRVVVLNAPLDGSALGDAVVLYPPGEGTPTTLFEGQMWDVLALLPEGEAVAVARRNQNHTIDLIRVPLDGRPASILTHGTILARSHLAFSGNRAVWSDCFSRSGLASLGEGGFTDLGRSDWADIDVASVPGNDRFFYVSDRTGKFATDRNRPELATAIALADYSPGQIALSRDGTQIAFVDRHHGLLVAPVDGSSAPRLLAPDTTDVDPTFDRHGTTIYFGRLDGDTARVMSISTAGGDATPLLAQKSYGQVASPTDDMLAYISDEPDGSVPMLLDLRTGKSRKLLPPGRHGFWNLLRWSPDGARILLADAASEILEIEVATGRQVRAWSIKPDIIEGLAYVGDTIIAARTHWTGDLWTATLAD